MENSWENMNTDMYLLLTKHEIKMAGYWPISLLHFYGLR